MRACSRCGTQNEDGAKVCVACGLAFEAARPAFKQTMLGMAGGQAPTPPAPAAVGAAPKGPPLAFGGTMLGLQSPFAAAQPPPPPPPAAQPPSTAPSEPIAPASTEPAPKKQGLQQTMLGFGPGPSPAARPPAPATPPAQNPYQTQPGFAAPPQDGFGNTMPVLQGPGQTAVVPAFQQAPPAPAPYPGVAAAPQPNAAPAPAPAAPPSLGEKRTMLGVAVPGIAPLHPGQVPRPVIEDPPPTPRGPSSHPPAKTSSAPPPTYDGPPLRRARTPTSALALIGAAVLLALAGVVVALRWEGPRAITAEVDVDERGNEVLALKCDDCPDGTTASLDQSTATFAGKRAALPLAKPLKLGQNSLKLATRRSGSSKTDDVAISVSLDYRVRGELSSLADEPPNAKVVAEAAPGAAVLVDGHALTLDANGKAEYAVDVSHDIDGPADAAATFEKRLPYSVTAPGGKPHAGQVTLKFGIVPLRVDAPGLAIVIDSENFMLAGRTLKDGRITVSGRPITVDGSGRFAQLMNISSEGETTIAVRADAKDYGPRVVHIRVKRVARLSEEGAHFRETAASEYSSIGDADAKKGFSVALDGEVVEARLDGDVTVLLLDVKRGCAASPCLARVVYGGRFDIKRGAGVSAYGRVLRAVDGPRTGAKIPEVSALFLVRGVGRAR